MGERENIERRNKISGSNASDRVQALSGSHILRRILCLGIRDGVIRSAKPWAYRLCRKIIKLGFASPLVSIPVYPRMGRMRANLA